MQRATKLIEYARSLSDLENSKFISYDDEKMLLNEAYRDLYSLYTETAGDYWTKEEILQLNDTNKDPNSLNNKEYLVDLPVDFYKIRFLSYSDGSNWISMDRFATSMRNTTVNKPYYRIKNNKLWILSPVRVELKITYYIPPTQVTLPDYDILFQEDEAIYDLDNKDLGVVVDNKLLYVDGLDIKIEDLDNGTDLPLFNATLFSPTQVQYYGGWIYWLEEDVLYRASTDFVTALTPVLLISAVENFLITNGKIYYSDVTDTYVVKLDGTSITLELAAPTNDYQFLNSVAIYIDATAKINYNGVQSTLVAERLVQYNNVMFYYIDNDIIELVITDGILSKGEVIKSEVFNVGYINKQSYLPIKTSDNVHAKSIIIDTEFDYPSNEVNEIMAYMSAIAFSRKQADSTKMAMLTQRLAELVSRFQNVSKRDEYQFYRINNDIGEW